MHTPNILAERTNVVHKWTIAECTEQKSRDSKEKNKESGK